VPPTLTQLVSFTIKIRLISFSSLSVPHGCAAFRTLPAHLAVGIPVEELVLIQAVKDISDYGNTLADTTAQFAAATFLSRFDRV
jgi:Na+/H+-dicarboxylate symporter